VYLYLNISGLEMGGGHTVESYLLWLRVYVKSLRKCWCLKFLKQWWVF